MNAAMDEAKELAASPPISVSGLRPATPAMLLQTAVERGANMETLERLIALQERMESTEARKAYVVAVAAFKSSPPEIIKDRNNVQYGSRYSSLAGIVKAINPALSRHGLSARWDLSQDKIISVACVLSHVLGHSERVQLSGPPDDSGKKNALQQIKSTVTYLEAATLLAITGLSAVDEAEADDDGNSADPEPTITDEQHSNLLDQIAAITPTSEAASLYAARLREFLKVESLDALPASKLPNAIAQIEARKKKIAESKGESK